MGDRSRPSPRAKPRGQFHHGDLREALVSAATTIVETEGHESLALRDLARRAGVSQPALYRHFASKEALLAEVARRGYGGFDAAIVAAADAVDDPYDMIFAIGCAYVRHAHAHRAWFRLFFTRGRMDAPILTGEAAPSVGASHLRIFAALERIMGAADPSIPDVFRAVWGLAHGLSVFVTERVFQLVQTDEERIAAADTAIAVFVDSLRARYARPLPVPAPAPAPAPAPRRSRVPRSPR